MVMSKHQPNVKIPGAMMFVANTIVMFVSFVRIIKKFQSIRFKQITMEVNIMNQKIHTTKDGVSMPICSMETDHLKNTVALSIRKLGESKVIIGRQHSKFEQAMYGKYDTENAERFVDWFFENFPHYFLELSIRDSESAVTTITDLVKIIGRNSKIQLFSSNKLLSERSRYEDEELADSIEDDIDF